MRSVDCYPLGLTGAGLGVLFTFGGLRIWALIVFIHIATKTLKRAGGPLA